MFVYAFVLFFILTPGILLSLPPKGGKMLVAATHAFVFALVWGFTHKAVWRFSTTLESMTPGPKPTTDSKSARKPH
jgi:hypothetical protein